MKSNTLKSQLRFALKLLIGTGLIVYVFRSKMVDFSGLSQVLWNPINLLIVFVLFSCSATACSYRWFLLTRAQNLTLSFVEIFELTMIGYFFNTFMPGAVGGDLIKAWYIAGQEPQRRTNAVFTVLIDRVIGLIIILGYSAITLLFYTEWISNRHELKAVALSIWLFTFGCLFLGLLFFSPAWHRLTFIHKILDYLARVDKLKKIIDAGLKYRNHFSTVAWSALLSAVSMFLTTLAYSLIGQKLGLNISLSHYFFIVPLGLTISAIPLLPGGIGVGQVAFYSLFLWLGEPAEQGATLCTLMQIYTILFNCLGAVFYLKFRKKPEEPGSLQEAYG